LRVLLYAVVGAISAWPVLQVKQKTPEELAQRNGGRRIEASGGRFHNSEDGDDTDSETDSCGYSLHRIRWQKRSQSKQPQKDCLKDLTVPNITTA